MGPNSLVHLPTALTGSGSATVPCIMNQLDDEGMSSEGSYFPFFSLEDKSSLRHVAHTRFNEKELPAVKTA